MKKRSSKYRPFAQTGGGLVKQIKAENTAYFAKLVAQRGSARNIRPNKGKAAQDSNQTDKKPFTALEVHEPPVLDCDYDCPHCNGKMNYAREHCGMQSLCPHCQKEIILGQFNENQNLTVRDESNVNKIQAENVLFLDRANKVVFCPNGCPSSPYSPAFENEDSKCPTCGAKVSLICKEPSLSVPVRTQISGVSTKSLSVNQFQANTGRRLWIPFNANILLNVFLGIFSIFVASVMIKQMLRPFPEYHSQNQTESDSSSHLPSFQEDPLDNGYNGFTWRRMAEMEKRTICDDFVSRFGLTEDFYFNALNNFYGYGSTTESLKMSMDDVAGMAAQAHDIVY